MGRNRIRDGRLTRRELLEAATLLGVGAGLAGCGALRASRDTGARFAHGVASGDPLADRVILWTRVEPHGDRVDVAWRVATDPALRDVVARGTAATDAARDFTVKVDAAGLAPGHTYYYGFEAGGEQSPVGRTRTLPVGAVGRLRLASCCCANYPHGYYNAYAAIARRDDLDVVLHLGDYIYEYGRDGYGASTIGRDVEPPHAILSLADYRARYAFYRRDPDLQEVHRRHPWIAVWDDHEFANDAWRGGAQNHHPETEGPWEPRRRAAARAWREWMPVRIAAEDGDAVPRTWRSFSFGDLADLAMLDTRAYARDQQAPRTDRAQLDSPARGLLGAEQERWLLDWLGSSRAGWRLVGQQVVFAPWSSPARPPNADAWDGYTAARGRILDRIESGRIRDVVVLSGDVHSSWALEVPRDPFSKRGYDARTSRGSLAVELVAPAIASSPLASFPNADERFSRSLEELPHLRWFDLVQRGYVLLDVDRERARAEWWFADTVAERRPGERRAAAFEARRGTNRLEAV
jgi:alkaline phosphatase D